MISERSREAFSELFLKGVSETVGQSKGSYSWETKELKNVAEMKSKEFILFKHANQDSGNHKLL